MQVSRRTVLSGGLAAGAALAAPAAYGAGGDPHAALPPSAFSSALAQEWVQALYDLTWHDDVATPLGMTPPNAARCYAYVVLGMYEAVVAGEPGLRSTGGQLDGVGAFPVPRGRVDWPMAMAQSAHDVIRHVHRGMSPARLDEITARRDRTVADRRAAGVPDPVLRRSLAHGSAVAAVVARRADADGFDGIVGLPYTPPVGPGLWESTPPNYRPAIEPYWARVRPLAMLAADEVSPVPHVPFSDDLGSAFAAQALATYRQSAANGDEERAIARFWTDNPLLSGLPSGHWLLLVGQAAAQHGLDLARTLEALARTGVALHDAFLSCWAHKYTVNLVRPISYVRRYVDPTWTTFVNTPQFPEYPSGHSVSSMAAATVLTDLLGPLPVRDDSHRDRGLPARSFASFDDAAAEAAQSRIYGGIHYPMGVEGGLAHGTAVGRLVVGRLRTRR
ncbi:vanadium-dependent haloperoxidase [Phycicoccus flavus]|uniref:Vanadium-dependent haloperoxidase n=1 Tax=Phycicoccus flavus TaxID=2502783 RepID=A0A8T6R892_9MICO|nr:vanadium-dependent haloperoxidase [Phycicoccus flavus]NHA68431.1 vanadium-dependent haloperoxidase [Phycicoccus flavus]